MTIAKVFRLHGAGGTDVMRMDSIDVPSPGPGQVRLRMRAIGVTRGDILYRKGGFPNQPALPHTLGFEGSGEIESIGEGVEGFAEGDAVSVVPLPTAHYGTYGELVTIAARHVTHHPREMSFIKAAALWSSYITAYNGLVVDGRLERGEKFVLTAGSSGVGIAAIQIARILGAEPIAITRTAAKAETIRSLGAAHVIVAEDEGDIVGRILDLTNGNGVRLVLDAAGGPMIEALAKVLQYEGTLVCYGMLSPHSVAFPLADILIKGLTVKGSLMTQTVVNPALFDQARQFLIDGIASGEIDPPIAAVFKFDEMAQAHELVETNAIAGKVVVEVNS